MCTSETTFLALFAARVLIHAHAEYPRMLGKLCECAKVEMLRRVLMLMKYVSPKTFQRNSRNQIIKGEMRDMHTYGPHVLGNIFSSNRL